MVRYELKFKLKDTIKIEMNVSYIYILKTSNIQFYTKELIKLYCNRK